MEVNYICHNTIKSKHKSFYLTPSIAIYMYNGVSIKSCIISFAWLVFSFSIDIIIKRGCLNNGNESYLNNKTTLEEFQEYVKSEGDYDSGVSYVVGIVSDIINKPENDYLVLQKLKETILKLKKDNSRE